MGRSVTTRAIISAISLAACVLCARIGSAQIVNPGGGGGGGGGATGPTGPTGAAGAAANTIVLSNDTVTGTATNKIVELTTTGTAITISTAHSGFNSSAIGICTSGCGTTGSATITNIGPASCVLDAGGATAGDLLAPSGTVAGACTSFGAPISASPNAGLLVGRALATGAGGTTISVDVVIQ